MVEPNDAQFLRDANPEEQGVPDLESQPPGWALSGETPEDLVPPGDEFLGADKFGTTAAEQARGETLAERVAHEEPELDGLIDEGELGRLVEGDDEPDAEVATATGDVAGLSAEEAAVHVVEAP